MGNAPVNKPSLFRNILQGAMVGMGAGLAAERPEQAFGAGMEAVESNQDREMKRAALLAGQQREEKRLGMEQQRVGIEQQQANQQGEQVGAQVKLSEAQRGLALTQKLQVEKAIEMLPAEQSRAEFIAWGQLYSQTGLQPVVELDATQEAKNAFLTANKDKIISGQYTFGPSTKPGKITVFQADPKKIVSEEQAKNLSGALNMKIPAGIPTTLAEHIIDSTMQMRSSLYVAQEGYRRALEVARITQGFKVPQALEKQVNDLDMAESRLVSLLSMFDSKATTSADRQGKATVNQPWVGGLLATGVRGALKGEGSFMGGVKQSFNTLDPERATFYGELSRWEAIDKHDLYGAALTATELKAAKSAVLTRDMSPMQFRAALIAQIGYARRAKQILYQNSQALQARQAGVLENVSTTVSDRVSGPIAAPGAGVAEEYVRDPKTGKLILKR